MTVEQKKTKAREKRMAKWRVHPEMQDIAAAVTAELRQRGWKLNALAAAAGLTTTPVYGLLHYGRLIQAKHLEAIAAAVGLRVVREDGNWRVLRAE